MDHFADGTWKLVRSENFENYARHMGVPWLKRQLASMICPSQSIKVEGSLWNISTSSAVKRTDVQLTDKKECSWLTYDGRQIRTKVEVDGQRLILQQQDPPYAKITREFTDTVMIMTLQANGTQAKRIYHKQSFEQTDDDRASVWSRAILLVSVCAIFCAILFYYP